MDWHCFAIELRYGTTLSGWYSLYPTEAITILDAAFGNRTKWTPRRCLLVKTFHCGHSRINLGILCIQYICKWIAHTLASAPTCVSTGDVHCIQSFRYGYDNSTCKATYKQLLLEGWMYRELQSRYLLLIIFHQIYIAGYIITFCGSYLKSRSGLTVTKAVPMIRILNFGIRNSKFTMLSLANTLNWCVNWRCTQITVSIVRDCCRKAYLFQICVSFVLTFQILLYKLVLASVINLRHQGHSIEPTTLISRFDSRYYQHGDFGGI